jgi:hypothetical protein
MTGGALVLAATMSFSGTTFGNDADDHSIDPATQAAWFHDHFCCEHAAQMTQVSIVDPATQAAWFHDHFCCEHAAEMAEA